MKIPHQNFTPCAAFDDDLKAYFDGELPFFRRFQVRRHLQNCPQCREEIRFMQTLTEEMKVEDAAPLDVDLRAKILQNAPQNAAAPLKNRRRAVKKLGLALAGIALLAVGFNSSQLSPLSAPTRTDAEKARRESGDESNIAGPVDARTLPPSAPAAGEAASAVSAASPSAQAPLSASPVERSPARRGNAQSMDNLALNNAVSREPFSTTGKARRSLDGANLVFSDGHVKSQDLTNGVTVNGAAIYAPPQRAVHREGSVTVAVDNAETASESVAGIVKNVGGFIATNSLSTGGDGRRSATLDVRAPVEQFETLVVKIGALGTVRAKSINGEDITQRITQANARRAVLSKELSIDQTRLREKEAKAKKSDVASISQLRAEVRDSRLRAAQSRAEWEYLRKYAALSTLYVVLQDKTKPTQGAGWTSGLGPTGAQAWNTFTATAKLPLQLLIWILAYAPLWVPALMVWKKWGRKWVNA